MKIVSAKFVTSASTYVQCPTRGEPVYAFLGRSNVGKSSLINMLLQRKKLAKTSSTPGKTSLINYFLINDAWYMVDLPGYGWARTSQFNRQQWSQMTQDFLTSTPDLTHLFLLIDSRHDLQKIDLIFMDWLVKHKIPFTVVLTKTDKIKKMVLQTRLQACARYCQSHFGITPTVLSSSATHRQGREAVLEMIDTLRHDKVA